MFVHLLAAAWLTSAWAYAGASGVDFSNQEISDSNRNAVLISETAAACLSRTYDTHTRFFQQRKYSKYYGNRHPKHKTEASRKEVLLKLLPELAKRVKRGDRDAIKELQQRSDELEATSCIGLALTCLGEGFEKAGMKETWTRIFRWVGRKGADGSPLFYGTDLQKALVDLGWKSLYWNPDVSQNEVWDSLEKDLNPLAEGKVWNPVWGGHVLRWNDVRRKKTYYEVPIQDIQTLVNFGISPPADFKRVPFFLGTAHAGYHVFPGFNGKVIEAHSMRELNSRENLEVGEFNPLNQPMNGVQGGTGAPRWTRTEHYRSGVMVVPPGYIASKPYTPPGPARDAPKSQPPLPKDDFPPIEEEDPWNQPRRGRPWWGR
jgi:hypothetical protein